MKTWTSPDRKYKTQPGITIFWNTHAGTSAHVNIQCTCADSANMLKMIIILGFLILLLTNKENPKLDSSNAIAN